MAKASVLQPLKAKEIDVATAADRLVADPGQIPELVETLQAEKGSVMYTYEKTLRLVSKRRPELIHPHFDAFVALLDHENNFLKWGAIMTVANLTAVDTAGRFETTFDKYYGPIKGPTMVTASNIVGSSPRIIRAKPHLTQRIAREILKVEKARYEHHGRPSPECRNVAIGQAIDTFGKFFDPIEDKATVLAFVRRQLRNTRKQVAKRLNDSCRPTTPAGVQTGQRLSRIDRGRLSSLRKTYALRSNAIPTHPPIHTIPNLRILPSRHGAKISRK